MFYALSARRLTSEPSTTTYAHNRFAGGDLPLALTYLDRLIRDSWLPLFLSPEVLDESLTVGFCGVRTSSVVWVLRGDTTSYILNSSENTRGMRAQNPTAKVLCLVCPEATSGRGTRAG